MNSSDAKVISKSLRGQVYQSSLCDVDYCWVESHDLFTAYFNDDETGESWEEGRCGFHGSPMDSQWANKYFDGSLKPVLSEWASFNGEKSTEDKIPFSIVDGSIKESRIENLDLEDDLIFSQCDFPELFFLGRSSAKKIEYSSCNINILCFSENERIDTIYLSDCNVKKLIIKKSNINKVKISNCVIGDVFIEDNKIKNDFNFLNTKVTEKFSVSDFSTVLGGDLSKADVEKTRNVTFSGTYMKNSKYKSSESDPWKLLKKKYTGANMFLSLLFLFIFISPFLMKAIVYKIINFIQSSYASYDNGFLFSEKLLCGSDSCSEIYLFKYILGSVESYILLLLSIILVIYNMLRGYVTYAVNVKSKDEDLSGYYPNLRHPIDDSFKDSSISIKFIHNLKKYFLGYCHLVYINKLLSYLMWIAILSVLYRLYSFLSMTVWIPEI